MSFEDLANQNDWRGERSRFFPYPGRYNVTVHCWGKFARVIAFAGHEYTLGEARMTAELNYEHWCRDAGPPGSGGMRPLAMPGKIDFKTNRGTHLNFKRFILFFIVFDTIFTENE